jgi:hypothetical protein
MSWIELGGTKMKVNVDDVFTYNIALYVTNDNEDHGLQSIKDYMKLNSFCKLKFFWLVVRTLEDVKLIKYIWFFAQKRITLIKWIHI